MERATAVVVEMAPLTTSVKNSARMLGVCQATIYNWIDEGRIDSVRVGGRRLIKIASIQRLVSAEEG